MDEGRFDPRAAFTPRLHEICAAASGDEAAAAFVAAAWMCGAAREGGAILWARPSFAQGETGALYGAGFAEQGLNPDDFILVSTRDDLAALQAALDGARSGAFGAVMVELWGEARRFDLTASRRLDLAAAKAGLPVMALRRGGESVVSSAMTRWSVASAPSASYGARAPGRPVFDIALLRHRGGARPGRWRMEWIGEERRFAEHGAVAARAPLSGALVPASARGSDGARRAVLRRAG